MAIAVQLELGVKMFSLIGLSALALMAGMSTVCLGEEAKDEGVKLKAGDPAPEFSLPDQDNKVHKLSAYRGKWVVLYFYPKDDTPDCTKEACGFQDKFRAFTKLKVQVFGINNDSMPSHKTFAKKNKLKFPLLADTDKVMLKAYGVWGKFTIQGMSFPGRWTFLIKPDGTIAKVYDLVDPAQHANEILTDLAEFGVGGKPGGGRK